MSDIQSSNDTNPITGCQRISSKENILYGCAPTIRDFLFNRTNDYVHSKLIGQKCRKQRLIAAALTQTRISYEANIGSISLNRYSDSRASAILVNVCSIMYSPGCQPRYYAISITTYYNVICVCMLRPDSRIDEAAKLFPTIEFLSSFKHFFTEWRGPTIYGKSVKLFIFRPSFFQLSTR